MSIEKSFKPGEVCACGRLHKSSVDDVAIGKGTVYKLPEYVKRYGAKKAFIIADVNTYEAAGRCVEKVIADEKICYSTYVFKDSALEPDERAVGGAIMHFDHSADILIGVGSGTINDICKIVAKTAKIPYIIVGTAPSMDGYASASSSVVMDGLKVSLNSRCPNVIIGDIDILKEAPAEMLVSGLGDMLAKYVSIAEWRISNLINGEYYCEDIAAYIRRALRACVDNAEGLLKRDEASLEAVFEGLVACGAAMEYAGLSRPASGVEHYISHVWDMRGVEFGSAVSTHGIQCAIGTLMAAHLYEEILATEPSRKEALEFVENFDFEKWSEELRGFLGRSAEVMIAGEKKDGKYDKQKHKARLELIFLHFDEIKAIIREEIPNAEKIRELLVLIGCPTRPDEIGIDSEILPITFKATKDIRDKYVLSRLVWDLGIEEKIIKAINNF